MNTVAVLVILVIYAAIVLVGGYYFIKTYLNWGKDSKSTNKQDHSNTQSSSDFKQKSLTNLK